MNDLARLSIELPASTALLGAVRAATTAWLRAAGAVDEGEWPLVATELVTNSIEAVDRVGTIRFELALDAGDVVMTVTDTGEGFDLEAVPEPGVESPRGRGLHLVSALVDDWGVDHADGRTRIWARRPANATSA